MKAKYSFALLRYVPDPVTQEFATVGIVVSAPDQRFLKARFSINYGRITRMFGKTNGLSFRSFVRHLQVRVNLMGERLATSLFEDLSVPLGERLSQVLPIDDSAFQFASGGSGTTDDVQTVIDVLYQRYVERYEDIEGVTRRDDEDVWRKFKSTLERGPLGKHLEPKLIASSDYGYEFQHSWKNGIWHLYEPLSLDLGDASTIVDKANRWVGRVTTLADSPEPFKVFFLLGKPMLPDLQDAFHKAQNILNKAPADKELVEEDDIEAFARQAEQDFAQHMKMRSQAG